MATTFLEAGTAATFGLEFWTAFGGFGEASEATIVHTGPRSLKLPNYGSVRKDSVCQDSGTRLTFYVYFSALPPSSLDFCRVNSTTTGKQIEIRLLSTGILRLHDHQLNGERVPAVSQWRIGAERVQHDDRRWHRHGAMVPRAKRWRFRRDDLCRRHLYGRFHRAHRPWRHPRHRQAPGRQQRERFRFIHSWRRESREPLDERDRK